MTSSFASSPIGNRSENEPIQVWADVGGTFTDVFVVDSREQAVSSPAQATKVLSSGRVYAIVQAVNGNRIRLDRFPAAQVPDFWKLAGWSIGESCRGDVVAHSVPDAADPRSPVTLSLAGPTDKIRVGDSLVLDAGLEAPVLATRILLGLPLSESLPELHVRLGTTRGTNVLLTRTGAKTALMVTRGFRDVLRIGEQDREELFALDVVKRPPLTDLVVEVDERMTHKGTVLKELDESNLRRDLAGLRESGVESIAICFLHSHAFPAHELRAAEIAREFGFSNVSRSSEVSPLIKLVSRCETTTLDAYLNPVLAGYVDRVLSQFGGPDHCRLRLMTSGGNLVSPDQFRGRDSVLSGPAGGVVALAGVAKNAGISAAIGLDMGGTSTDVSRFEGVVGRRAESRVAGLRFMTPMMDIQTVAAGGGSICDFRDQRLTVGPDSAGASPGPACYGRGGPLTITDVNLLLGRLPESKFPFQLNRTAAENRLTELLERMPDAERPTPESLAEGYLDIAITHMAEAVRSVSTAEGSDVRAMALVGFGGAAGAHLCRVAEMLGMKKVLDHPDASMLSALGMGLAHEGITLVQGVYRPLSEMDARQFIPITQTLKSRTREKLDANHDRLIGEAWDRVEIDLRYRGTEAALTLRQDDKPDDVFFDTDVLADAFHRRHQEVFGYTQPDRPIECVAIRCDTQLPSQQYRDRYADTIQEITEPSIAKVWLRGRWQSIPQIKRRSLRVGDQVAGPAMIVSEHSTLILESGWQGNVIADGVMEGVRTEVASTIKPSDSARDRVLIEVIARRLQGIADTMGEVLRRTSISVNVKERRDYSCAVFNGEGELIANAAHVPVHLGAMGHTVRHLVGRYPTMSAGDAYLSNDPFAGGSHLPDVTLVTPVFVDANAVEAKPDFFVASRAHHAEIGGKTPGSMPPDGRCLAEEGVVIRLFALRRGGIDHRLALRELLSAGPYPSRSVDENLADIAAAQAAGIDGASALRELAARYGTHKLQDVMRELLDLAEQQMRAYIAELPDREYRFTDVLDDQTPLGVTIRKDGHRLVIEFDATPVHPLGFNATPAIVTAAVLYVLRCVCPSELPLCDGVLRSIDLRIPEGMLHPPLRESPLDCAAVVAGNVETSQRLVDVLLGALGVAAASQGTMNNTLMGDETFGYYETLGGGSGATENAAGADGVHSHMTNTRITDPEVLESRLPVRLNRFELRSSSGGKGKHAGGNGLIREFEFLRSLTVSLLTNRRTTSPYGMAGGQPGTPGKNLLIRSGLTEELASSTTIQVHAGDRLVIQTPGGGGWGQ